jgi:hypothetical protein
MSSWNSYGKIYAIGHRATHDLFNDEVTIEEKVDGSQFSFGVFDGKIRVRSRGREFEVEAPDDLFRGACETVQRLSEEGKLTEGWTYRGEVLKGPKHNVLCYDRAPIGNIIIFDIAIGDQDYMPYETKAKIVSHIGLEVVPLLFKGKVNNQAQLDELKGRTSVLGGQPIEGYVVKAYDQLTRDKKVLMGKWVSEAFKEVHRKNYKSDKVGKLEVCQMLAKKYTTEARWAKAVQHRAEAGELIGGPEDIGPLIGMVSKDLHAECEDEIKQDLFDSFWKGLQRSCTRGLAEWYKHRLESEAFDE